MWCPINLTFPHLIPMLLAILNYLFLIISGYGIVVKQRASNYEIAGLKPSITIWFLQAVPLHPGHDTKNLLHQQCPWLFFNDKLLKNIY